MLLLKGFFRKKSTRIYLIIFSILLISIITIFSFINYYHQLANDIFKETSYIVVSSKNDYYNDFVKYKNVTNVEKAILFEPNYTYDTLGRTGYVIRTPNGALIDSREAEENIRINWEDFFIDGNTSLDNSIFVFPNKQLINNQISLGIASEVMQRTDYFYKDVADIIAELVGQKIGFYNNLNTYEFVINNFYESYFSEMTVSEEIFDEISKKSNSHVYRLEVNDYKEAILMTKKIQGLEKDIVVSLNERRYHTTSGLGMEDLKELIRLLSFVSYIVIFLFAIVFLIVTRNILRDEYKNIRTERLLGYNKMQIKKYLILKEIILNTFATLIAIVISLVVNNVLNLFLNIKLILFNYSLLSSIYIIILFVTLLFCFFFSINKRSNMRTIN